jgi:hypothetical protein
MEFDPSFQLDMENATPIGGGTRTLAKRIFHHYFLKDV